MLPNSGTRGRAYESPQARHSFNDLAFGLNTSVEELQANVIKTVDDFARGVNQADDITLLILRYLGHT